VREVLGIRSGKLRKHMEETKHNGVGREAAVKFTQSLVIMRPDHPNADDMTIMQF
jgi:hypothetical protein